MIAKNIKFLRNYYGEGQKVLQGVCGVGQSTMSGYETGKNVPAKHLKKIADWYHVSVDDLVCKDLSVEFCTPFEIDIQDLSAFGQCFCFFMTSNIAKENATFNRACAHVMDVINDEPNVETLNTQMAFLKHAIALFQKAWEETHAYAALANCVGLVLFMHMVYEWPLQVLQAIATKKSVTAKELMALLNRSQNFDPDKKKRAEKQHANFTRYEEMVMDCIKKLKTHSGFSQLGDFYLALCTLLGFVEEGIDRTNICSMGVYWMFQLYKIENPYAERFIDNFPLIS